MARTPTVQLDLGYQAPEFSLPNVLTGNDDSFSDVKGEHGTVVMFICNHCPFVIHVMDELVNVANDYKERGIDFVAISSNDVSTHPDDSPELMKKLAERKHFLSPICTMSLKKYQGLHRCLHARF